jgi:hypothetical protein
MMTRAAFNPNTQKRMVYAWKPARGFGIAAQVVGEAIAEMEAIHGECKPPHFVEAAKPKESPLHPLIEWDNWKAADAYRLHQARQVINSVIVIRVDNHELAKPIQAFVNITQGDSRGYVSTVFAMGDEEKRNTILENARRDLAAWRNKYQALSEFSELFVVIDRATEAAFEAA